MTILNPPNYLLVAYCETRSSLFVGQGRCHVADRANVLAGGIDAIDHVAGEQLSSALEVMLPEREFVILGHLDGGNVVMTIMANKVLPVLIVDVAALSGVKREDGP